MGFRKRIEHPIFPLDLSNFLRENRYFFMAKRCKNLGREPIAKLLIVNETIKKNIYTEEQKFPNCLKIKLKELLSRTHQSATADLWWIMLTYSLFPREDEKDHRSMFHEYTHPNILIDTDS